MLVESKRPTLHEIARLAGCSKAAVSTVLNHAKGNTVIGPSLRRQVQQVARDLGYVPRFASRSLATGITRTLGIYIPAGPWAGIGAGYERLILSGIETACQAAGYDMLIVNLSGSRSIEDCLYKVAEQRVDGLLAIHASAESVELKKLVGVCRNLVAVDYSEIEPREMDAVVFDNRAAMEMAVDHLWRLGHRRIGYVGDGRSLPVADDRLRREGYLSAIRGRGIDPDRRWSVLEALVLGPSETPGGASRLAGSLAVDRAMALGTGGPTALITFNDLIAAAAIQQCHARGVGVPGRLSIVGVDDSPLCQWISPQLTSIRHPLRQMGQCAAEQLIERAGASPSALADAASRRGRRVSFAPELVVRQTTAAALSDSPRAGDSQ